MDAEFGDIFVCSHVLRRPLLDGRPRVKVEHLRAKSRAAFDRWFISATFLVSSRLYRTIIHNWKDTADKGRPLVQNQL